MSFIFEVSSKYLQEASKIKTQDEFCFIYDEKKIVCNKLIAAFISPKVCQMLISDPTENQFYIQSPASNSNEQENKHKERVYEILYQFVHNFRIELKPEEISHMKEEIKSIGIFCKESEIQDTQLYSIISMIEKLGNDEILSAIYLQLFEGIFETSGGEDQEKDKDHKKIDYLNMMSRMNRLMHFLRGGQKSQCSQFEHENYIGSYFGPKYNEMIDSIAEEFFSIEDEEINEVEECILGDVLRSSKLKIVNEDWLLEKLLNRRRFIEEEKQRQENEMNEVIQNEYFIDEVRFEYLSSESVRRFIEEFPDEEINGKLWCQIKKRLVLQVVSEQLNENSRAIGEKEKFSFSCKYENGREFEGILRHLTNETNGNICDNQTIEITCSKKCCGGCKNVVDYSNLNNYIHVNGSPSPRWLKVDFKTRQIKMDAYVINTGSYSSGTDNKSPKSWKVEISNDNSNWETVDERTDVSEIKENNKIKVFEVNQTSPFRFMRIITDKDNHCNSDGFVIGNLEIYGGIIKAQ